MTKRTSRAAGRKRTKRKASGSPAAAPAAERMGAPDSGVTVRMYRAGLGDCFLLAFRRTDGDPFHMLIDCGVHSQVRGGNDRARRIVDHVRRTTGGRLDLVVVTHEHGDHISGFHAARETFESMEVGQLWFGWTEDPADPLAKRLDRARSLMLRGAGAAARALGADGDVAAGIGSLLSFFDAGSLDGGLGVSSRAVRDGILDLSPEPPLYLRPKQPPLTLPGVDGVRIFVLGPPEDVRSLMRARPSSRPGEVYHEPDHALTPDEALSVALLGAGAGGLGPTDPIEASARPFAGNFRLATDIVRENAERFAFFHRAYGFGDGDDLAWRRIERDWCVPGESLALKLDAATNNTSLVLAIELMATGKVLLFAGDAQVGNWHSWHDGGWSEANGLARGETVDAADLLRRTVLYKVGHHGSHNATLKTRGLEMMTSPDLAAMIPVDEEWALDRRPYPWKMPFGPLYADLRRRTGDRILRADLGLVQPDGRTPAAWRAFERRVDVRDLYVDLDVEDA
ncbi:MAG: hypothetical protein ACF8XB_21990 [Planctomycetota bacterium JB042]